MCDFFSLTVCNDDICSAIDNGLDKIWDTFLWVLVVGIGIDHNVGTVLVSPDEREEQ